MSSNEVTKAGDINDVNIQEAGLSMRDTVDGDDNDVDITIHLEIMSGPFVYSWVIPKSKLLKHSGFFRRMFSHDFKETRDNEVTLHDDDKRVLEWLLETMINDGNQSSMTGILPGWCRSEVDLPEDKDGNDLILVAYSMILKYDCPEFMGIVAHGLVVAVRFILKHCGIDGLETFVEKQIDFITDHSDGRYPVDLAPAIAEAWTCLQNLPNLDATQRMEPVVAALIERQPGLAMAVAKHYQTQLIRAEASVESAIDIFRKPK